MVLRKTGARLDSIGITASTLCAIHCAIVPVLITFLPLAGLGFLANPFFEWGMILLALLLGVSSIFMSYVRTHRRILPLLLLLTGFVLVVGGHLFLRGWMEAVVVPTGGLTIAFSHFVNYKYVGICSNAYYFPHLRHKRHTHHDTSSPVAKR